MCVCEFIDVFIYLYIGVHIHMLTSDVYLYLTHLYDICVFMFISYHG